MQSVSKPTILIQIQQEEFSSWDNPEAIKQKTLWLLLTTSSGDISQFQTALLVRKPRNQKTASVSPIALSKTKWVSFTKPRYSNSKFVTALVDDDIVIKLVKGEIDRAEEAHQSWIITGFPRTKV